MSGGIVYSVEKHARKNRMSDEEYEAMVEAAQDLALRDYKSYRIRVILLTALGYAFCLAFVGIFLVFGAFFVKLLISSKAHYFGIKGAILFGALAFIVIKAMWVKMPPLEGRPVTRAESPALFELIDDLSTKLNTRIDVVLLNEEFNCAVEQRPRLGLLGWSTNALHLGLPMMAAFTPEQFSAVLAHEMGHLSGNHGTLSMIIYRLSVTWNRVLDQLRGDSPLIYALFFVFANWYMPIFGAYTFSLRRKHEQDADESAAELVGAKPAAEAHIRSALIGQYLDKVFWERIRNLPKTQSEAPSDLFEQMVAELKHLKISDEQGKQWLREDLEQKSNLNDPHPCSRERIDVLNCPTYNSQRLMDSGAPPELLDIQENAADRYLGAQLVSELAKHYSQSLYEVWKEGWQAQYNEYEQTRKQYQELEEKRATAELDSDEMLKLATAVRDLHSVQDAMQIVDEAMTRFPGEAWPYAVKGMTLVGDKDESGVPLVEKAILMDTRYLESGCQTLIAYYDQKGRKDLVKKYTKKLDAFEDVKDLAREERFQVKASDEFEPATLPSELLDKLRCQIADYKDVDEALIARKQVQHLPEYPHYVIAIKPKFSLNADERNTELVYTLSSQLQFDESFCITVIDGSKKKIEHKLKEISEEPLYSRKASKN